VIEKMQESSMHHEYIVSERVRALWSDSALQNDSIAITSCQDIWGKERASKMTAILKILPSIFSADPSL